MKFISKKSLAFVLVLCLLSTQYGCGGIDRVITYTQRAIPLLSVAGVDTALANEVLTRAKEFKENPSGASLALVSLAFDRLVARAQLIPEQGKKTVVLVMLVAANIALQELADKYLEKTAENPNDPRVGAPADRARLRNVAGRKKWACRASGPVEKYAAGQFMPMEMCKKYPDNSVVETQ